MFRGGRDWPVACNEIPNLILASLAQGRRPAPRPIRHQISVARVSV
jgi:hypothetical protein